jgi:hypothetical protein
MITVTELQRILRYNPRTGIFRWKASPGNQTKAGEIAGTNSGGYVQISIDRCFYGAHRLAWLYMTGFMPACHVEHKNLKRSDNRWKNLRLANGSQNQANRKLRVDNTSGYKGVSRYSKDKTKWVAQINLSKQPTFLGLFDDPKSAYAAYVTAAKTHYGEFARVR